MERKAARAQAEHDAEVARLTALLAASEAALAAARKKVEELEASAKVAEAEAVTLSAGAARLAEENEAQGALLKAMEGKLEAAQATEAACAAQAATLEEALIDTLGRLAVAQDAAARARREAQAEPAAAAKVAAADDAVAALQASVSTLEKALRSVGVRPSYKDMLLSHQLPALRERFDTAVVAVTATCAVAAQLPAARAEAAAATAAAEDMRRQRDDALAAAAVCRELWLRATKDFARSESEKAALAAQLEALAAAHAATQTQLATAEATAREAVDARDGLRFDRFAGRGAPAAAPPAPPRPRGLNLALLAASTEAAKQEDRELMATHAAAPVPAAVPEAAAPAEAAAGGGAAPVRGRLASLVKKGVQSLGLAPATKRA